MATSGGWVPWSVPLLWQPAGEQAPGPKLPPEFEGLEKAVERREGNKLQGLERLGLWMSSLAVGPVGTGPHGPKAAEL